MSNKAPGELFDVQYRFMELYQKSHFTSSDTNIIVSYIDNKYYIATGKGGLFSPLCTHTESKEEAITHIMNKFYEKFNLMMIVTKGREFDYNFGNGYFDNSRELLIRSSYGDGKDVLTMEEDEIRLLYKNSADIENRLKEEMKATQYVRENKDTFVECNNTIIYSKDTHFVFMDKESGEEIKEPIPWRKVR